MNYDNIYANYGWKEQGEIVLGEGTFPTFCLERICFYMFRSLLWSCKLPRVAKEEEVDEGRKETRIGLLKYNS